MVEKSLKKTGRLLIAHESIRTMGFSAEIIAEVTEKYFDLLRSPPSRVASPRIPVPYSKPLEDICRVGSEKIVQSVLNMVQ
jgi:pyruvate dehydrogenase E1 component beta subunit